MLDLLFPLSHSLPLSLDSLNKTNFTPESKDEDLHAGILQLPQGTVLLVSEGGVREGQLHERGMSSSFSFRPLLRLNIHFIRNSCRRDECSCAAGSHGRTDDRLHLPLQPVLVPDRHRLRHPR